MKTFDYALLESMHEAACKERDALRAENASLTEALQHPSYKEENRLRAELDALKNQPPGVPERITPDGKYGANHHYAEGWNDAIDAMLEAAK